LGQRSGDGESLLLSPGKQAPERIESVFDFVPEGSTPQTTFHDIVEIGLLLDPGQSWGQRYVVVDCHWETDRQWKNDPDQTAQGVDVSPLPDISPIKNDLASNMHSGNKQVHAVQGPQKGRFPGVGWSDYTKDLVSMNIQGDILKGNLVAISDGEIPNLQSILSNV
jgi:hypothetical protein